MTEILFGIALTSKEFGAVRKLSMKFLRNFFFRTWVGDRPKLVIARDSASIRR